MNIPLLVALFILALAAVLLIRYIRGLLIKSRELEKTIDYSKMKKWKDDDEDER